jgi:hypothetical protein
MVKWSELKRASDVVLAVWPHYRPLFERWFMQELIDKGELAPMWRERMVPGDNDTVFADHYPDREAAIAAANVLNPTLRQALSARAMDPVVKRSLELKIDKALQAKQRLQDEEALMLAEALRRHADDERTDTAALKLAPDSERYRQDLAEQLVQMPYLRLAKVGRSNNRWTHSLLYLGPDGIWSKPYHAGEKAALTAERAKIANGFDLSASTHWGKTKASASRESIAPTRERSADARRSSCSGRTCAGLKWHRFLVRAGWRCRLADQRDVSDARVRGRDDLEGRDDPLHQSRPPRCIALH